MENEIKLSRKQLTAIENSDKSTPTERTLAKLLIEERDKIIDVVEKKNRLYGMMYKCWLFMEKEEGIHEKRKIELQNNVDNIKSMIDKVFNTHSEISDMVGK